MINGFKRTLAALALAGALSSPVSALPTDSDIQGPSLDIGLSAPCHGLLALRGVFEFNDNFAIQTDLGLFTGIDFRAGRRLTPGVNLYGYAGVIAINPLVYLLSTSQPDGAPFAVEAGAGIEFGRRRAGLSFGIEGGFVFPIPPDPNTQAFRIDANVVYRFPLGN